MYRVSRFMDLIRKIPKESLPPDTAFYRWFETYEEAKNYCIERAKAKVEMHKKEIKGLERKLIKLSTLTEKVK